MYLFICLHENEVYIYIYRLEIYTHQMELHPLNGGMGRTCVICLRSICWNSCDFPYIRRWAEWFLEARSSRWNVQLQKNNGSTWISPRKQASYEMLKSYKTRLQYICTVYLFIYTHVTISTHPFIKGKFGYPWEGTLAVLPKIFPYCHTQPLYNPYKGGISWYISLVLSQGYPTFPVEFISLGNAYEHWPFWV